MTSKPFHLCLTMAGAVSAGAYTAGAFDELTDTLKRWELAKMQNRKVGENSPLYDHSVPMHDVIISVLSGASAGGITASLGMLSLTQDRSESPSLLFRTWVEMADTPNADTLLQLLDSGDLKPSVLPLSLLNTTPIEKLAGHLIVPKQQVSWPAFLAKDADLALTTTNLRGLPFEVDFGGDRQRSGTQIITSHASFFRFRFSDSGSKEKVASSFITIPLNDAEAMGFLREATLSTAAFPIALKARTISLNKSFLQEYPSFLFGKIPGMEAILNPIQEEYRFHSIDGGLINNEPYGLGVKLLKERLGDLRNRKDYAVVMIDPFPNQNREAEETPSTPHIGEIAKGMFKSLRNQALFNQEGILEALSLGERTRFMIVPKRSSREDGSLKDKVLASAPLSGFGGFFDRSFREHDYYLGRKNTQDFLRFHLTLPLATAEERLGTRLTTSMTERFAVSFPAGDPNGEPFFPIVPDLFVKRAFDNTPVSSYPISETRRTYPVFPYLSVTVWEQRYGRAVKKRIRKLIATVAPGLLPALIYQLFYQKKVYKNVVQLIKKELEKPLP